MSTSVGNAKLTELLWEDFFTDPSQFWDVRSKKKNEKSPDFRHKRSGKALWIDGWYTPPWALVKLQSLELPCLGSQNDRADVIELIKSCEKEKNISRIRRIHADKESIIMHDVYIATTLIRTYAKCGALRESREVFDQLEQRNVASWNALIAGYADQGFGEEAITCYRQMQNEGVVANKITYVCCLKACAVVGSLEIVDEIHEQLREQGLLKDDIVLGNALLNAYANSGGLKKAQEVFDKLPKRNVVSWSTLIGAYADHGFGQEALRCFRMMESNGVAPVSVTYTCILKACSIVGCVEIVDNIKARVKEQGLLENNVILGTALISAYAKCGALREARECLDELECRNVASWNALMVGYADHGYGEEALTCLMEMKNDGLTPNPVTYVCSLRACVVVGSLETVKEIHVHLKKQGFLQQNNILGNALVNAYAKCGALKEAWEVFDRLSDQNVVSWSALIAGYVDQGLGIEALTCYQQMQVDGVVSDDVTYISLLKACAIVGSLEIVEEIYTKVTEQGLLKNNVVLGTALVHAFAKCGAPKKAWEAFMHLPERTVASWNAIIAGCADGGCAEEAFKLFNLMEQEGLSADSVTYHCVLRVCAVVGSLDIIETIHEHLREQGLLMNDIMLGNTLINSYAKCGALNKAVKVFYQLPVRDAASWSALIAGYTDYGYVEDALICYREMENDGVEKNSVIYVCSLKACALLGSCEFVKEIHVQLIEKGLLKNDIVLGNALVNSYTKCGALKEAHEVFDNLPEQDVGSWCALLAGFAHSGQVNQMLELSTKMMVGGIVPDLITFLVLLNGCSHGALLEDGQRLFDMIGTCGLAPTAEHYTCMVDLFGRAGLFDKAVRFVIDDESTLMALLGACHKWLHVDLGRWAFDKILQLNKKCPSAYVCMANIYSAAGMTKEANEIEYLRVKQKAWRKSEHG